MGRHSAPSRHASSARPGSVSGSTPGADSASRGRPTGLAYILRQATLGLVICALVAGCLAFASLGKELTVVVDGAPRTITTYAVTVGDVMDEAEIDADANDIVLPEPSSRAKDGATVTVVHARPIVLSVDGASQTKWVAALTVDEALAQLGYDPDEIYTRASRSTRLPMQGAELDILTPKALTVVADGKKLPVSSAGPTVADALADSKIVLGKHDQLSVPAGATITEGMTVTVTRVKVTTVSESRPVPFKVVNQPDPETYVGINAIVTPGVAGTAVVDVQVTTVEGKPATRKDVGKVVAKAPVDQVVQVGAKQFPAEVNALNWNALSTCESTNNPKAISASGTYTGLFQFSDATWQSVGGTGRAMDAPPEEQLARAKMLYMRSGAGQWECGGL